MPIVTIQITRERTTPEQKAAGIKGATDLLADVLNKPPGLTLAHCDLTRFGQSRLLHQFLRQYDHAHCLRQGFAPLAK